MRFKKYILESTEDNIKLINADCKPFLNDMKSKYKGHYLYSGRRVKTVKGEFIKKKIRTNRKNKDTPFPVHNLINDWFNKKFGFKAKSNAMFCSFNKNTALVFGQPYKIYPIGQYTLLSSNKVRDMIDIVAKACGYEGQGALGAKAYKTYPHFMRKEVHEKVLKELDKANYKNKQYNDSEQILHCKEVYLLRDEHII